MSIKDIVVFVVVLYIAIAGGLFFAQRAIIYFPGNGVPQIPEREGAGFVRASTEDGLPLVGWYAPASAGQKTILYFHGNAGHIGHRLPLMQPYIDAGYGVMMAEYRGYGGNPGKPTEAGLYKDARAYHDFLSEHGVTTGDIVLYGESIGSGVAVQLAHERSGFAGLLLVTPFSSFADVAKKNFFFLPVKWMLRDKFDNLSKIGDIIAPVYFFVGKNDQIVPVSAARALYERAGESKEWHEFDAGHNDIDIEALSAQVLAVLTKL